MEKGKFKVELVGGELQMQYEIAEGQFVKMSAPLGAVLNPALEGIKADLESGKLDLIKGTELEKGPAIAAVQLIQGYLK